MKLTGLLFAAALLGSVHAACRGGELHAPCRSEDRHRRPRARLRGSQRPLRPGAGGSDEHSADVGLVLGLPRERFDRYRLLAHAPLSGTGIGDLFDITVMPVMGEVTYARGEEADPASGLWSYADRTREIARNRATIRCRLTRYGITGRADGHGARGSAPLHLPGVWTAAAVVFDLENGGCWDKATETGFSLRRATGRVIAGWRLLDGVGQRPARSTSPRSSRNPSKEISKLQSGEIDDSKTPRIAVRLHVWTSTRRRANKCSLKVALIARKYRRREGKPCGGTPRMGFRRYGGRCRQGVER